MESKIVFEGKTDKGTEISIRYPQLSDATAMTDYINALSDERTFITYQGEHETLESETKFLTGRLTDVENNLSVFLIAFYQDRVIGISWIGMDKRTSKHIGVLGISVAKEYRGKGVGKLLMDQVLNEGKRNLEGLEIITLGVFANNEIAINWYKGLEFVEYGRLPKGIKLENSYEDHVYMYKRV